MAREDEASPTPRGIEDCDSATLEKWHAARHAMAPYNFKTENGVLTSDGEGRPPNAAERERLHGFKLGHTAVHPEGTRISLIGNSFH